MAVLQKQSIEETHKEVEPRNRTKQNQNKTHTHKHLGTRINLIMKVTAAANHLLQFQPQINQSFWTSSLDWTI